MPIRDAEARAAIRRVADPHARAIFEVPIEAVHGLPAVGVIVVDHADVAVKVGLQPDVAVAGVEMATAARVTTTIAAGIAAAGLARAAATVAVAVALGP